MSVNDLPAPCRISDLQADTISRGQRWLRRRQEDGRLRRGGSAAKSIVRYKDPRERPNTATCKASRVQANPAAVDNLDHVIMAVYTRVVSAKVETLLAHSAWLVTV